MRVNADDVWMQGFAWLGKIFFEIALVFGCVSSPGLYDRVTKVVLFLAMAVADIPPHLVIQHLDDVCACVPEGSHLGERFYAAYKEVCEKLNIKLADESDADKAFSPKTEGQVLGVNYDSV